MSRLKGKKLFCVPKGFYETFNIFIFYFCGKYEFDRGCATRRFSLRDHPSGLAYLYLKKKGEKRFLEILGK